MSFVDTVYNKLISKNAWLNEVPIIILTAVHMCKKPLIQKSTPIIGKELR
jgi:hypothetical protein